MAFQRMETNVENVSSLPDIVAEQSAQLKQTFDKAGKDLKAFINTHIGELGNSGAASNLGALDEGGGISTVQAELDKVRTSTVGKVDKEEGKQLSTEDYTTEEKDKLASVEENANNYVLPVASTTETGGIKVDGTTIVIENGIAKAKAADAADYTARAEIANLASNVLTKDNTTEYTPTSDYHPATKKYVDSLDFVTEVTAADVIPGTFSGVIKANDDAVASLETAQIRNIKASTEDLTAGTSELTTGNIVLIYE